MSLPPKPLEPRSPLKDLASTEAEESKAHAPAVQVIPLDDGIPLDGGIPLDPSAASADAAAIAPGADQPAFSHLDTEGAARMVDISSKPITRRVARASCRVLVEETTVARLSHMPKGDAVTVARLAGIQAAKRVDELVPLAHTLALDHVDVQVRADVGGVRISSEVVVTARTGAEIEAMVACSNAALALYDMVKAVEKGAVITDLRLEAKSGGRSGDFRRGEPGPAESRTSDAAEAGGRPPEQDADGEAG